MKFNYDNNSQTLYLILEEEIDHHIAEKVRTRADYEIQKYIPRKFVVDFSKVSFMDSAGIGMLIGRYKTAQMFGAKTYMENVKPRVKKIFEMSGVLKIIPIIKGGTKIEKCI